MSDPTPPPPTGPSLEIRLRRVLWILLSGILVVAAGTAVSAWALSDAAADVDRAERARETLGGVLEGMVGQESAVRGFILTGQERFLETYGPSGTLADEHLELLRELAIGIERLTNLDAVDDAIGSWREIADEEIRLVRSGRVDEAVAIVESGAPKARFDVVREQVRELDRRLTDAIDARNLRQVDLQRALATVGAAVLLGGVFVIVTTLRWVRRAVIEPLALLSGAVGSPEEQPLSELAGDAAGEVSALALSTERLRLAKDVERNEAVLVAEQAERSRIAADLHDGPVQTLFAIQLQLQRLVQRHPDQAEIADPLRSGVEVLEQTQAELRSLIFDLAPPGIRDRPLADVLSATVAASLGPLPRCTIDVAENVELDLPTRLVVHRTVVEALRNVDRHAQARAVVVRVRQDGALVSVDVVDDGRGFAAGDEAPAGHFGLEMMRSLVESLGGSLQITSIPGEGTTVHFDVPA